MNSAQKVGFACCLIAGWRLVISDVFIIYKWYLAYGSIKPAFIARLGIESILAIKLMNGSPVARWLLVTFSVLSLVYLISSKNFGSQLRYLMSSISVVYFLILSLPFAGKYQEYARNLRIIKD